MSGRKVGVAAAVFVALLLPCAAAAQPDTQFWANVRLRWIKTEHFTLGLDTEPKILVSAPSGDPGWATLDIKPSVEYGRNRWFDVLGDVKLGRTRQSDELDSTEVTPRVGLRFHILSNVIDAILKERQPGHRLVLSDLLRLEWRNLYYSTDEPDSSTRRLRNRFEMQFPVTQPRITDDGATYLQADVEWFWTNENPDERFASQQRIRAGLGYRHSRQWRFGALYVWDRSRDSANAGFTTAYHALDLELRRVW